MNGKREFGDYQTPQAFAQRVCHYLQEKLQVHPTAVIEPTCGLGNFLNSSLIFQAQEYYGIELNEEYCRAARERFAKTNIQIIHSDIFRHDSRQLISNKREILILGNPPWVTNSTLAALGSDNLPAKGNVKGLKGLDAVTGASNFDICEYIILKLIEEYRGYTPLWPCCARRRWPARSFKRSKGDRWGFLCVKSSHFRPFRSFMFTPLPAY